MSMTKGTPASSQIIWLEDKVKEQADEIERLRKALRRIANDKDGLDVWSFAESALKEKE